MGNRFIFRHPMSGANSTDNFTAVEVAGHAHRLAHHLASRSPAAVAAKKRAKIMPPRRKETRKKTANSADQLMRHKSLEVLPISKLQPYARNARVHSKKQIRQIADSILRFGFTNPVLIDNENTILAGHCRVAAARLLGMDQVP